MIFINLNLLVYTATLDLKVKKSTVNLKFLFLIDHHS